ncbi:hypothetical protein LCGC14_2000800 [marine sediment metagenome]|uniref:HTH cro/C1-type domain-containing protein n=1 Tax=marine sediment metagenome TaxID=412755 RepID=A0A0F9I0F0_9ZZZZ
MEEHPLFTIYKRRYLSDVTGYSVGYLCRIATGGQPLSRSFMERVCFKLKRPEEELFLTNAAETCSKSK